VSGRNGLVRTLAACETHDVVSEDGLAGSRQSVATHDLIDVARTHHAETGSCVTSGVHHDRPPRR
jgi:hypothetical protein